MSYDCSPFASLAVLLAHVSLLSLCVRACISTLPFTPLILLLHSPQALWDSSLAASVSAAAPTAETEGGMSSPATTGVSSQDLTAAAAHQVCVFVQAI